MEGSILSRLKTLSGGKLDLDGSQYEENNLAEFEWNYLSKSITLLRRAVYQGERYYIFFVHTPTVFKTRGKYFMVNVREREKLVSELEPYKGYERVNFNVSIYGDLTQKQEIPLIQLDSLAQEFRDMYSRDNTVVEVNDLLDVMDFINRLHGHIHMNPFRGIENLQKYLSGEHKFRLGNVDDYRQPVYNFVTSRERPTLSYSFLLVGQEEVDGKLYDRRKFYQYPLLSDCGEVIVDEIEFTVPLNSRNEKYVKKYLSHLIQEGSVNRMNNNELYFRIDTSKLAPISTLHELPINLSLVENRERTRMILRSLREFKKMIKEMARRTGVPIRDRENIYVHDKIQKKVEMDIESKVIYHNENTRDSNRRFKEFIEKSGSMGSMKYVEDLINNYLNGKATDVYVNRHIIGASKAFKNPIANDALKALFVPIVGCKSLNEMFEVADDLTRSLEPLSNSLKMRLHVFGDTESQEAINFMLGISSSIVSNVRGQQGYVALDYNFNSQEGSIEMRTEIKM